jgi:hypothetical protein
MKRLTLYICALFLLLAISPSVVAERLLVGDPTIQAKVKAMQEDGVLVEACVACATKLGLVDQIRALGYEVKGMGAPLTRALKDPGTEVLTF